MRAFEIKSKVHFLLRKDEAELLARAILSAVAPPEGIGPEYARIWGADSDFTEIEVGIDCESDFLFLVEYGDEECGNPDIDAQTFVRAAARSLEATA